MQVAIKALGHPAAGVKKAAIEVLPKNQQTGAIIQKADLINDPNLNVRMSALLAIAALPASNEMGRLIYTASLNASNTKDEWLVKALFAAAVAHEKGFIAAVKNSASPTSSPATSLSESIVKALNEEIYPLQRRGTMQFPPDVISKEIIVKASVTKRASKELEGLIMAQGGKDEGYAVFIQNGKLKMVVKQGGKTYAAATAKPLPEEFELVSQLRKNGEILIQINGKQFARAKAPSLFTKSLVYTVRSGQEVENEAKIGNYEGSFDFTGNIQNASLELKKVH
jgi:hypothetical protein